MKPSKLQVLFAQNWLWQLLFWGCPVCIALYVAMPIYITQKKSMPAIILGTFTGVLVSFLVIRVLFYVTKWMNGFPFHKGDTVQILVGKHKGHVAKVYDEWPERNQVRVDLGEKETVADVFNYAEIFKIEK